MFKILQIIDDFNPTFLKFEICRDKAIFEIIDFLNGLQLLTRVKFVCFAGGFLLRLKISQNYLYAT